jgi:hypothetical protein
VIDVAVATTTEEREAVFRFWYSVYVEEMGRYRSVADHAMRMLHGPEDERALIFYAADGDEVVGACRWSWGADGFSDRQISQYQLEPFLRELPHEVMIVGERTMVSASHRGGSVYTELGYSTGPLAAELGIDPLLSFGACEPHLISYYAQFGQRPYAARQFWSEESGYIIPTIFLIKGAESFGSEPPACIRDVAGGSPSVCNAAADGDERYADALREAVGPEPLGVFAGMTEEGIALVAARGTLLACSPGEEILRRGGTALNPFVVLSGRLQARRDSGTSTTLGRGDLFGESGWLGDQHRQVDVFVMDGPSTILALSDRVLRTLTKTDPSVAAQLHANVAALLWTRLHDVDALTG